MGTLRNQGYSMQFFIWMKVVGITGGIGSGKSTVCEVFEVLGFPVYHSDERAKFLQDHDPEIIQEVKNLLGEAAYTADGLNRTYVAGRIFQDADMRQALNAIVHPRVRDDFESWKQQQNSACIFQESALIYEIGRQNYYDRVVLVTAPLNVRVDRVVARDHSDKKAVEARINAQLSDEEKKQFKPYEIVNDDKQAVLPQVQRFLREINAYSTSS